MSATTIRSPWGAWMTARGDQSGKIPGTILIEPITDHAPWGTWMTRRGDQSGKQPGTPIEPGIGGIQRLFMVNNGTMMNQ